MTLLQMEYMVAVDRFRHFAVAADHCHVSQPTLSMQLQKAETLLGVKVFDRSKQPVVPTEIGALVLKQIKKILAENDRLQEIIEAQRDVVAGELRVGIIPTLAPYLLPLFVQRFIDQYPLVKLIVNELTTGVIVERLKAAQLDVGILVTPLQESGINEQVLFYEELMAYVSKKNAAYAKKYVLPQDIDPAKLWLLEEGHCFRSQIMHFCELRKSGTASLHFDYEAGSIETLRRMVEVNDGVTILPELATLDMTNKQLGCIRYFKHPAPMREVSMITHRDFIKARLVASLRESILSAVPAKVKLNKSKNIVPVL